MSPITSETILKLRPYRDAYKRHRCFHRHASGTGYRVRSDITPWLNAYINRLENRRLS